MSRADTAKRLGVTVAGLSILAIAAKDPRGRAIGPATQAPRLELRQNGMLLGMDFGPDLITQAGRDVVAKVRDLGW